MSDPVIIRHIQTSDRPSWNELYRAYANFYEVAQTDHMRTTVWSWLMDPNRDVNALVALQKGKLIGFAHYRSFDRPLAASTGGFLDDLFVIEEARGTGAADALMEALVEESRKRGWSILRWITAEDNIRARKVYDRVALATPWVTYDLTL